MKDKVFKIDQNIKEKAVDECARLSPGSKTARKFGQFCEQYGKASFVLLFFLCIAIDLFLYLFRKDQIYYGLEYLAPFLLLAIPFAMALVGTLYNKGVTTYEIKKEQNI